MPLRCQWLWRLSEQCSGSCECCRRDWLRYVRACRNSSRPRCACVSGALHRLCIPRRHRAVSASSRWTLASLLSPAASTGRRVIAQTSAAAMLLFVTFGASGNSRMCSITAAIEKRGKRPDCGRPQIAQRCRQPSQLRAPQWFRTEAFMQD